MGGGSKAPDKTTQTAEPWSGVKPYLTDYLQLGQNVTKNPYQFYNGDNIAGFAPEQEMGMRLATDRALAGSPTLNAANTSITDTLNGNYLNPESNPYLKANVDTALGDVQTRINSQFNNSNFGSSAHQETMARDLGKVATGMYGQNYQSERDRQLSAAGQATGLANADYNDATMLQAVGGQRQGLANQYLNNSQTQFDGAANWPYEQLQRYGNVVSQGTGAGGTTTSTGPAQQSNKFAGALGGAATGFSIGGPWGAAIGGLGGLLLG